MYTNKYFLFIKSLRVEAGFSQLEIAEKLDISRSSYIAFEQGKRGLALAEANELAKIFQISLEDILNGKASAPKVIFEKEKSLAKPKRPGDEAWERISIPQEKVNKFKQALLYILAKVGGKPNPGIGQGWSTFSTYLYSTMYTLPGPANCGVDFLRP